MAVVLVLLVGAMAYGLLAPLPVLGWFAVVAVILVLRPAAGWIGLLHHPSRRERAAIAFFGIRGIGSLYYLSHGLNEAHFAQAELLWAIVGATVLVSMLIHGVTATPAIARLDEHRDAAPQP